MIAEIEDAIVKAIGDTLGRTIKENKTNPGTWTKDSLIRALQMAPSVYTAFTGAPRGKAGIGYYDGKFVVYVVTNGATEKQRRRGNQREIGAYEIIERLVAKLDGMYVQAAGTLKMEGGITNLFSDATFDLGATVYGIHLTLPNMPLDYTADESGLDDFITFDAKYDLDPSQDGEPEAEDTVTGLDKL